MVGQSSATGNSNYLYVDVNKFLLDGSPNPYFLRPYLGVGEPVFSSTPYKRDTFRGQLAYLVNFTNEKAGRKWLGRHQLLGYGEEKQSRSYVYRFRDVITTDNPFFAPAGTAKGNQSAPPPGFGTAAPLWTRPYFHFYVGDASGQNIDYAPGAYSLGQYTFKWQNTADNSWVSTPVTLGESGIQEGSAGGAAVENLLKTRGFVVQDDLLDDRFVFTGGRRHDENNNKFQKQSVLQPDGYDFDYAGMNGFVGNWATAKGDTTSTSFVVRPFRGWPAVERLAA